MAIFKPGDFCWVELMTTDLNSAKQFYRDIFSWQAKVQDFTIADGHPDDENYIMWQLDHKFLGGGFQLNHEMLAQGAVPCWSNYILVADPEQIVTTAKALGGKIIKPILNVFDIGRMAVIADPTGGIFSIWQPNKSDVESHIDQDKHGMFCWQELMTYDTDKAARFYCDLFAWNADKKQVDGHEYTEFTNGNSSFAGMLQITPEMGEMPPYWQTYFSIDNCDHAITVAKSKGGKVLHGPFDIPQVGRAAMLQDQQGACFSIIESI